MQKYYKISINDFRYDEANRTHHFLQEVFPTIYALYVVDHQFAISYETRVRKVLQKSFQNQIKATNLPTYFVFEVILKRKNDYIVQELVTGLQFIQKEFHLVGNEIDEFTCVQYLRDLTKNNQLAIARSLHRFVQEKNKIIPMPTAHRVIKKGQQTFYYNENDSMPAKILDFPQKKA